MVPEVLCKTVWKIKRVASSLLLQCPDSLGLKPDLQFDTWSLGCERELCSIYAGLRKGLSVQGFLGVQGSGFRV